MACHPVTGEDHWLIAQSVYNYAQQAGFSPTKKIAGTDYSEALVFTAISGFKEATSGVYESGGHTDCYNGICCYGLWQINWDAWRGWLVDIGIGKVEDLSDPLNNAKAAYLIFTKSGIHAWSRWGAELAANGNLAQQLVQQGGNEGCDPPPKGYKFANYGSCIDAGGNIVQCPPCTLGCEHVGFFRNQVCPDGYTQCVQQSHGIFFTGKCVCIPGANQTCPDQYDVGTNQLFGALSTLFAWIQNPLNWKILGLVILGGLLGAFALWMMAKEMMR